MQGGGGSGAVLVSTVSPGCSSRCSHSCKIRKKTFTLSVCLCSATSSCSCSHEDFIQIRCPTCSAWTAWYTRPHLFLGNAWHDLGPEEPFGAGIRQQPLPHCPAGSGRCGWDGEESVGHRCQLSHVLSHILVLCLLFLDKEDIQPVNSHKMRLEARRHQWEVATSVGSWPCSLASTSPSVASPFPRLSRGCERADTKSPGIDNPLGGKGTGCSRATPR